MPGTGTPEVGGMSFDELIGWFKYLKDFNIVGADVVVELAPDYDATGASTAVATKSYQRTFNDYGVRGKYSGKSSYVCRTAY